MQIDYRSDTVTRPTPAMLDAMQRAEVGDAVFGDDPTVLALEQRAAELFGMDGALFCPSGTMTNQIAIKAHTTPGDQMVGDQTAHVFLYEGGGAALHSGVCGLPLQGDRGCFTAEQLVSAIQPDDPHFPRTRLVVVENTSNKGGGTCWDLEELRAIHRVCADHDLRFHLDGARLFNALVETGATAADFGELFDSISICLSKGLGAPVGSLLLGDRSFLHTAHRMRKAFGGGMRQAGYLAAAGLHALDHHIERLAVDHTHARRLGSALGASRLAARVYPVVTNIVLAELASPEALDATLGALEAEGILAVSMSPTLLRFVTHLDISETMVDLTIDRIARLPTAPG